MPFCDAWERATHFAKHGHEFAAVDAMEYERIADDFIFGPRDAVTHECTRPSGHERLRFDFVIRYFGVARVVPAPECVKTFYVVKGSTVAHHGGAQGYFQYECGRINV